MRKNLIGWMSYGGIVIALAILSQDSTLAQGQGEEETLKYYINNMDSAFSRQYFLGVQSEFTFKAQSLYYVTDYRGIIDRSDTAIFRIYGGNGKVDSIIPLKAPSLDRNIVPDNLGLINVWNDGFKFHFFPNDTGAGVISIGFEPRNPKNVDLPSGILMLDRDNYLLVRIDLNFVKKKGFVRYSETYQPDIYEGIAFPGKIEIDGAYNTFFSTRYFKQVIIYSDYQIQ